MKLIMAHRLDPWTGYEATYRQGEPRTIQLQIRDNGELYTRWGPVIERRVERQEVHMRERSSSNGREEDFIVPLAELERLYRAPDWQRLPDEKPHAYWRKLSREGYATLALRPDPQGQLRGDYLLLTIYQCIHWFDDGSCITTFQEFASGEGNEGAIDQASTWSAQVEHGELLPLARLNFTSVPLAVGTTVKILDGGWNNKPVRLGDQPRNWNGKEAVIVEAGRPRGYYQVPGTGDWQQARDWYVTCEGERLKFALESPKEISASYYTLAELNAHLNTPLEEIGAVIAEQQYHIADQYALRLRLDHLYQQAGYSTHSTLRFPNAASLRAWLPDYRIISQPQGAVSSIATKQHNLSCEE